MLSTQSADRQERKRERQREKEREREFGVCSLGVFLLFRLFVVPVKERLTSSSSGLRTPYMHASVI